MGNHEANETPDYQRGYADGVRMAMRQKVGCAKSYPLQLQPDKDDAPFCSWLEHRNAWLGAFNKLSAFVAHALVFDEVSSLTYSRIELRHNNQAFWVRLDPSSNKLLMDATALWSIEDVTELEAHHLVKRILDLADPSRKP